MVPLVGRSFRKMSDLGLRMGGPRRVYQRIPGQEECVSLIKRCAKIDQSSRLILLGELEFP